MDVERRSVYSSLANALSIAGAVLIEIIRISHVLDAGIFGNWHCIIQSSAALGRACTVKLSDASSAEYNPPLFPATARAFSNAQSRLMSLRVKVFLGRVSSAYTFDRLNVSVIHENERTIVIKGQVRVVRSITGM